ncbi:MAG: 16S rRNA (cytidine(1402)-2'-O)-methyltransferase [Pseudomonadota bacterium]
MPSTSLPDDPSIVAPGTLYVVATPIGNFLDITLRALAVLRAVDSVAAEDTRETGKLLAAHDIHTPQQAYHEHNEEKRTPALLRQLADGASIALVSDAGTPTVSDPGYRLIRAAGAAGIPIVPVPGVSAALTALSVSGLPTDRFHFVGFLAKKAGHQREQLRQLAEETATLVFFESPRRVIGVLTALAEAFGDRQAVLGREMTKRHEEFIRGTLRTIADVLAQRPTVKGECTLLVAGRTGADVLPAEDLDAAIRQRLADGQPASAVARDLAKASGMKRAAVYERVIQISKTSE